MSVKIDRLGNIILETLSKIIFEEVKNPLIRDIVLTSVSVTNDLSYAKVYYTSLNEEKDKIQEELEDAKGFLRSKLSESIDIRHTPELVFIYDTSIEYGMNIERIIKKIHENE